MNSIGDGLRHLLMPNKVAGVPREVIYVRDPATGKEEPAVRMPGEHRCHFVGDPQGATVVSGVARKKKEATTS